MEGRDTARERGLPGHIGAVISKDRQELAATSRVFCLWDAPESIQGVSTGPCSLWSISRAASPAPGTQCPQGGSAPPPAGSAPSLGSFPFPKANASLGLPSPQAGKGHWGTQCSQSSAVEPCWSWVCQWDAQHQRAQGRDKCQGLPPRPGNLVQALPQHVLAATGTGMHLDFCTDTAQPPASLAAHGHQPQTGFLSL